MYLFKNKTIKEIRKKIFKDVGNEILTNGGNKVFIGEVENLQVKYISFTTGMEFQSNGEVDFDKSTGYKKMFGFDVETYIKNGDYKVSQKQQISVPYDDRYKKNFVYTNFNGSILSNAL